ncbi:YbjN_AmyR-like domain containing protein [Burkholderiaceae bacterium]
MNRKILSAVSALVLLFALYAGTSWYIGGRVQAEANNAIDSLNTYIAKNWSDQVRVTLRSYQRGVFTSEASYLLTFPASKTATLSPEVVVVNRITHDALSLEQIAQGKFEWLSASIHTTLAPTAFTEALFKATGGQSLIDGHTQLNVKGVAKLDWVIRPVDHTQDTVRSRFAGATLVAELGPTFHHTKGELKVKALNITDGKVTLDIKASRLHTDTHPGQSGLSIGISGADIGELTLTSLNFPTVTAKQINTRLVLNEKDNLLTGQSHYDIERLSIDKKDWGTLQLTASYDKLNGNTVKSLGDLYTTILTRLLNSEPEADLTTAADLKQFWGHVQTLVKNSPTVRLDPLIWQTANGQSSITLSTVLAPVDLRSGGLGLNGNPLQTIDATIAISRAMAVGVRTTALEANGIKPAQAKSTAEKDIASALDVAAKLKLGALKGDRFVAQLSFKDNVVKVNGQVISAETLLTLASSLVPASWLSTEPVASADGPDEAAAIRHLDPSVLASILSAADFTFEEVKDEQGDPLLKVSPGDSGAAKIDMVFVGCGNDPSCEDVLLRATYSPNKPVALKVANDWNLRNRWARAFVNDKKEAVIEMDISAYGGIGRDAVEGMVNTFFKIVRDFSKELEASN